MSAWLTDANRLRMVRIVEVRDENPRVKTFTFYDPVCGWARPGQFVMVWVPGVDEVPMSLSSINVDGRCSITVKRVGEATEALHGKSAGDLIGVRGPFGNGFTLAQGNVLIVGGGTGIACLLPLTEALLQGPSRITLLLGGKTEEEILFKERLRTLSSTGRMRILFATEDGSLGFKGVVTELMEEILAKERFDAAYTCGPEGMMHQVFQLTERHGIPLQASLERIIRCGIGICGSCLVGRFRICRDGPVLSSEQLREVVGEFGRFRRDFDGRWVGV